MGDVNFYKNAILQLKRNHDIIISVMERGNLPKVVKKEFGKATIVGKHCKGSFSKKAYYNIKRVLALHKFINKIKPDIVTSFSYYPAAAVYDKNIPSIVFHDDAEYKMQFRLCKFFAKRLIIPDFISINGKNIKKYHSYKEWAYLNPKYFKPNPSVLKKYNLIKNKYIFIRETASISLNYKKNIRIDYSKIFSILKNKGLKIVVSLENKSRKNEFKDCIVLKEPVEDFYSLVYYALALISSGDTMIREAALLGIPAFYTGKRKMSVNKELAAQKLIVPLNNRISIDKLKFSQKTKEFTTKKIKSYCKNLDDTTGVIADEIVGK